MRNKEAFMPTSKHFDVTWASAKGNRPSQEDRVVVADIAVSVPYGTGKLLAVMDGHNGSQTSNFISQALEREFRTALGGANGDIKKAIAQVFEKLCAATEDLYAGSTLSMVYVPHGGRTAYAGILGDSPVVVHTQKQNLWIGPEHNVFNPAEVKAVEKRGGILRNGYFSIWGGGDLDHGIQLSRALGDKAFRAFMGREPEIFALPIGSGSIILVASDGITDHVPDAKDLIAAIILSLKKSKHPSAQGIVKRALRYSEDNVSAIVWQRR